MKKGLIILSMAVLNFSPLNFLQVQAEWVNVQNVKEPIRLLDIDSIKNINYKDNNGAVFVLRYMDRERKEKVATFFADFENKKAGVISVKPYKENMTYDYTIPDDFEMKNISEFKTNFSKIEQYVSAKMAKTPLNPDYKQSTTESYLKEENAMEKAGEENPEWQTGAYWEPYMKGLERHIKKNWHPPMADSRNQIIVKFKLSKDGNLLDYKIQKSSGNKAADDAAIRAIKLGMPYKSFPKEATVDAVDIEFTFDYNVLKYERQNYKTGPKNTYKEKYLKGEAI